MQKNQTLEKEYDLLRTLAALESLAEKKTKIYSRLLTDAALAQNMEALSVAHEERKNALLFLAGEKVPKNKNEAGRYATSGEDSE